MFSSLLSSSFSTIYTYASSYQWLVPIISKTIVYTTTSIIVFITSLAVTIHIGPPWIRIYFSKGPLGLQKMNKISPKKHSICTVKNIKTIKEFLKTHSTSYRSCYTTLCKQVPKSMKNNHLTISQIHASKLSFSHFFVILSHERRNYNFLPFTFLISMMRFLSASLMIGTVDEFYTLDLKNNTKTLVAWSSSIVWHKCYRAMWFYQTNHAAKSKFFIWYATLRIAIERSILLPNVEYIDLGPSISKNVIQAKGKYGFDYIDNWYDICYHLHGEDDDSGGIKKHQTFQYDDSTLLPSVDINRPDKQ